MKEGNAVEENIYEWERLSGQLQREARDRRLCAYRLHMAGACGLRAVKENGGEGGGKRDGQD